MARYDVESLIDDIKSAISDATAGLNAKLTAIDTEKADGITLAHLDYASGISLLEQRREITAYDPHLYILVGALDPLNERVGGHNVKVELWLGIQDTIDGTIEKRLFRYTRALMDIFERDWRKRASSPVSPSFGGFAGSGIKTKDESIQALLYTNINLTFAIG